MSNQLDFFIDQPECEEATFEFYLDHYHFIKSITVKSITFYNSWWTGDFLPDEVYIFNFLTSDITEKKVELIIEDEMCPAKNLPISRKPNEDEESYNERLDQAYNACISTLKRIYGHERTTLNVTFEYQFPFDRHFSLSEFCNEWEKIIKRHGINFVKFHCDNNNYLIIELTEDKEFFLDVLFEKLDSDESETETNEVGRTIKTTIKQITKQLVKVINKWFGFKQEVFTKKGKYYSTKPLLFYVTDIFLRCNLVNQEHTFYNSKHSDILCSIPVKDGDQIKLQRHEPNSCTRRVDKATNHLKFQITDENGKVVNFRASSVLIHFTLETIELSPIENSFI